MSRDSGSPNTLYIKNLNLETIQPSTDRMYVEEQGGSKLVVIGKPGTGKCLAEGTPVIMFDGTVKLVEQIKEGDLIMGDDSKPRTVLSTTFGEDRMYKVTQKRGDSYTVNEPHILSLICRRPYCGYKKGDKVDIPVSEYINKSTAWKERFFGYKAPVDFPYQKVPLDPYMFGYWLGDCSSYGAAITTVDNEVLKYFEDKLNDLSLFLKSKPQDPITHRIVQTNGPKKFGNQFLNMLRDYNLIKNKHIPLCYKANDRQTRLEVLAGFIDADGHYDIRSNGYDIAQKSEVIIDDIIYICRSLGLSANKRECVKRCLNSPGHEGTYYRVFVQGNISEIPCHIARKKADQKDKKKCCLSTGISVDYVGDGKYYGFEIDGNHRFLLGDFTVTHNTTLIASLLYHKKHIFPVGIFMSGSEDSNHFYRKIAPSTFVFNDYSEEQITKFITRQKMAKEHLKNPWAVILLDDCTDDPRIFNNKIQQGMYKRGRHWKKLYILSLQYSMDVKPVIRTNVDGVFILREPILKNRRKLWENYASIIPDFTLFCDIMDQITDDHTALYIHNAAGTNEWQECIFWYRADLIPEDFKFGCEDYWDFHKARFDSEYKDPYD